MFNLKTIKFMKKLLFILAALTAFAFTACNNKEGETPTGDTFAGTTWVSTYNGSPMTVAFGNDGTVTIRSDSEIFTRAYTYKGTYTYNAPNLTILLQIDGRTETFTGTYSNGVLRISGSMGTLEFTQTEGPSPDDGDNENDSNIGSSDLSRYVLGEWDCFKMSYRLEDGVLHEEESPFARMEADAEDAVIEAPTPQTRAEEELIGYETWYLRFSDSRTLYIETNIEYLNGQTATEMDYLPYTVEGNRLFITDSDVTTEFTISPEKDENGGDIMVLRYTSETTTEEQPWTERTLYLSRISGVPDDDSGDNEPSQIRPHFEFSGRWEVYASSDKNEKFGPDEDTEVYIYLVGYEDGWGEWYSRYLVSDNEDDSEDETEAKSYSVELGGDLSYKLLDGYSIEKGFYPMEVTMVTWDWKGNEDEFEIETWYIQLDPEDENLATWWNGDYSEKAYRRYLRRVSR